MLVKLEGYSSIPEKTGFTEQQLFNTSLHPLLIRKRFITCILKYLGYTRKTIVFSYQFVLYIYCRDHPV
jgi:hypothetical protein